MSLPHWCCFPNVAWAILNWVKGLFIKSQVHAFPTCIWIVMWSNQCRNDTSSFFHLLGFLCYLWKLTQLVVESFHWNHVRNYSVITLLHFLASMQFVAIQYSFPRCSQPFFTIHCLSNILVLFQDPFLKGSHLSNFFPDTNISIAVHYFTVACREDFHASAQSNI